jgi:NADPH-dependent ferric siderophore reductase
VARVSSPTRLRREPPPFRRATVATTELRSPRLQRITLAGPDLAGFDVPEPAASLRLLLPRNGELEVPRWNGNEFLLAEGRRPPLRTLTPVALDPSGPSVTVEVVLHGHGLLSDWAAAVEPGAPVAISGPGRGYEVDADARAFVLLGDETALPAIGTLLPRLPSEADVSMIVEVADPAAILALDHRPRHLDAGPVVGPGEEPGSTLVPALATTELPPGVRVWAAGEAAAMQRLRRRLFEEAGIPRAHAVVRGYWKHGRAGAGE